MTSYRTPKVLNGVTHTLRQRLGKLKSFHQGWITEKLSTLDNITKQLYDIMLNAWCWCHVVMYRPHSTGNAWSYWAFSNEWMLDMSASLSQLPHVKMFLWHLRVGADLHMITDFSACTHTAPLLSPKPATQWHSSERKNMRECALEHVQLHTPACHRRWSLYPNCEFLHCGRVLSLTCT